MKQKVPRDKNANLSVKASRTNNPSEMKITPMAVRPIARAIAKYGGVGGRRGGAGLGSNFGFRWPMVIRR